MTANKKEVNMGKYTTVSLLKTKKEILTQLEEGKLGVKAAASLLGITRQGLWKLRKSYRTNGNLALVGRKRGPKSWFRVHNRTPEWVEEKIEEIFNKYSCGPDSLRWIIEDYYHDELAWVKLSRSTIYRILVRRRVIAKREGKDHVHNHKYVKGYPGEEVQLDTTESYGKGRGITLDIIDDYSRWKGSYFYSKNTSKNTATYLEHFISQAPFPVEAVRVDNGAENKKDLRKFCLKNNIRLINNPVRTPEHNGKVERLHRTVEEECLWRVPKDKRNDFEFVNYCLTQHTQWYNTKRRHMGYKMNLRTPREKIEDWIINNKTSNFYQGEVNETLILYKS